MGFLEQHYHGIGKGIGHVYASKLKQLNVSLRKTVYVPSTAYVTRRGIADRWVGIKLYVLN